jgi:hypothetical protein
MGSDLVPSEITRLLGCAPDLAYARGDVLHAGRPGQRPARHGLWLIRTEPEEPGDLDAGIAALLARTTTSLDAWAAVCAVGEIDLFCGLFLKGLNEGLTISATSLRALADRGIELDLDIYGSMRDEPAVD